MRRYLLIAALLLLVAYALFEGRKLLEGPQISIVAPRDGSATSTAAIHLQGIAENISFLTVNDRPAFTDEEGNFDVLLSPPPGVTVLTVSGVDRFGRKVTQSVSITMLSYCTV